MARWVGWQQERGRGGGSGRAGSSGGGGEWGWYGRGGEQGGTVQPPNNLRDSEPGPGFKSLRTSGTEYEMLL